jgi:hypothetical protein
MRITVAGEGLGGHQGLAQLGDRCPSATLPLAAAIGAPGRVTAHQCAPVAFAGLRDLTFVRDEEAAKPAKAA